MNNYTARNVTITENELAALKSCLNYDNRSDQLSDNFSNGGQKEFELVLGWNRQATAALIGSLESKDLGYGDHNEGNGHIFWLSELAVNVVFDIIDQETTAA
jgi:hypothetical protein